MPRGSTTATTRFPGSNATGRVPNTLVCGRTGRSGRGHLVHERCARGAVRVDPRRDLRGCQHLRPTVRAAVDELVVAGLLVREHGRGMFVAAEKITQDSSLSTAR